MSTYDGTFFDYVSAGAVRSAQRVLPCLLDILPIDSVLDVGCGRGAWLAVFQELGVSEIFGVDGAYVDKSTLCVPLSAFACRDLQKPFDLERRFDLVISLEVAEHLPEPVSASFVESLTRHSDMVLFSAAPPGQGGHDHINEKDYEFWRHLFAEQGYWAIDYLRPRLQYDQAIEPWYRYNPILYVAGERFSGLPLAVQSARLAEHTPIADVSPFTYRIRKAIIRKFPVPLMTRLAQFKERRFAQRS